MLLYCMILYPWVQYIVYRHEITICRAANSTRVLYMKKVPGLASSCMIPAQSEEYSKKSPRGPSCEIFSQARHTFVNVEQASERGVSFAGKQGSI